VYLGGQMHRSSTCQNGSKNPHWNDTFYFTIQGDPMLRVEVWDNDAVEDDMIGAGSYNLMQYLNQGIDTTSKCSSYSVWVDLFYNGRSSGRICLGLQFNRNNMGMGGMGMNMGMGVNMGGMGPMGGMGGMGGMGPMGGMGGMGPMGGMGGNFNNGWGGGSGWNNGW
jgi:hypothetical protein